MWDDTDLNKGGFIFADFLLQISTVLCVTSCDVVYACLGYVTNENVLFRILFWQVKAYVILDPQCMDVWLLVIDKNYDNFFFFFFPATIGIALPGMDREIRDEYTVVIQAKDMGGHMGGLSGTTIVTVRLTDINDNPPKFAKSMWHLLFYYS